MSADITKPGILAFEITPRCRYQCTHCRAGADIAQSDGMNARQRKAVLDGIARYCKCVVILTGGEPMECDDFYELARHGRALGLRMVMASCGYPINDESVKKVKDAGIMAISLSIDGKDARTHDGLRAVEGAFDSAVSAAKVCKKAGLAFQVNTTITKSNIDQVPDIAQMAQRLGAACFNPFILVPTGRGKAMADQILPADRYEAMLHELLEIRRTADIDVRVTCGPQFARITRQAKEDPAKGCLGGREFGFISHQGDVRMCGFLDISAGNLVENDFDFGLIWQNSPFFEQIRDLKSYKGRCGRCAFVKSCGGCRARALGLTDDVLAEDSICLYQPGAGDEND